MIATIFFPHSLQLHNYLLTRGKGLKGLKGSEVIYDLEFEPRGLNYIHYDVYLVSKRPRQQFDFISHRTQTPTSQLLRATSGLLSSQVVNKDCTSGLNFAETCDMTSHERQIF